MEFEKLHGLGVHLLSSPAHDPSRLVKRLERRIGAVLPGFYRLMIVHFAAPLAFEMDVVIRTNLPVRLVRSDGTLSIDVLYGLGSGSFGLEEAWNTYHGRVPLGIIPIGAVPGGNLICMGSTRFQHGDVYLWDHQEERQISGADEHDFGNMYTIAASAEEFVNRLEIRAESPVKKHAVDKDKSWLDF